MTTYDATTRPTRMLVIATGIYMAAAYAAMFTDERTMTLLAGEEMVLETLGGIWFLLCSVLCGLLLRAGRAAARPLREIWVFGFLALFFFVCFGEELSWGQHLLGFQPPEAVSELSRQEELNLHNLWLFDSRDASGERAGGIQRFINSNRLFDYFLLSVFIVAPLLYRLGGRGRDLLLRYGVPRPPIAFAPLLLGNYAASLILVSVLGSVGSGYMNRIGSEIRESNNAFLCLMLCTQVVLASRAWVRESGRRQQAPEPA